MDSSKTSTSISRDLLSAFLAAIKNSFRQLRHFRETSSAILRFNPLYRSLDQGGDEFMSDTKYAYRVFEYLLLFVFLSRVFSIGPNLEIHESEEVFYDLMILLMFVFELLIVIAVGSLAHRLFYRKEGRRKIQSFFMYAFCLLFLPSYFIIFSVYAAYQDDDDALGGLSLLLIIIWFIFGMVYFYRLNSQVLKSSWKRFVITILLSCLLCFLLFLGVVIMVGAVYGEAA